MTRERQCTLGRDGKHIMTFCPGEARRHITLAVALSLNPNNYNCPREGRHVEGGTRLEEEWILPPKDQRTQAVEGDRVFWSLGGRICSSSGCLPPLTCRPFPGRNVMLCLPSLPSMPCRPLLHPSRNTLPPSTVTLL